MSHVQVIYGPQCDKLFPKKHGKQFQQWVNQNHRFQNYEGVFVDFDQALVRNGLHVTASTYDPNREKHATVRLSNPDLRSRQEWYTLHWRLGDNSVFIKNPDSEFAREQRQAKSKARKQRLVARRNAPSPAAASSSGATLGSGIGSANFASNSIGAVPRVAPPYQPVPNPPHIPAGGNYAQYTTAPTRGTPSAHGTAPSRGSVPQYAALPAGGITPSWGTAPISSSSAHGSFASHGSVPQYTPGPPGYGNAPSQGNASPYGFNPAARPFAPAGAYGQYRG